MGRARRTRRLAFVARSGVLLVAALAVLAVLIGYLVLDARRARTAADAHGTGPLVVYCAAGVKAPVEEVAAAYLKEFGVELQIQFGGSGLQLSSAAASRQGDLFIPADESYIREARNKGIVEEAMPVASMHAVLIVPKDNPRHVAGLRDVLAGGVKIAQANPDVAAIGKLTRPALERAGLWDDLKAHTAVFKPTVNDVANDVKIGSVDAGIVWDAVAAEYPALAAVECPELAGVESKVAVGVLSFSRQPAAAIRFARYLSSRDKGQPAFRRRGYRVTDGDAWAGVPELRLMVGAMLRPAALPTARRSGPFRRSQG